MRAHAVAAAAAALLVAGCGPSDTTAQPAVKPNAQPPVKPKQRVYTLGAGDQARIPAVGVTCEASEKGGVENLSCTRAGGGRNNVVFYSDSVVVWGGPDTADSYTWGGRPGPPLYPPRRRVFNLKAGVLGQGDRLKAPAAATTCTVTRWRDTTELACKPMGGGGRYRVSLFKPLVLVWDALEDKDSPVAEYDWAPQG
jgi:hypothetical protein